MSLTSKIGLRKESVHFYVALSRVVKELVTGVRYIGGNIKTTSLITSSSKLISFKLALGSKMEPPTC